MKSPAAVGGIPFIVRMQGAWISSSVQIQVLDKPSPDIASNRI